MAQVVVIGAGMVGLSCAYALRRDAHEATVLDHDPAGDKASFGNAGGLGVTEIVPASTPGLLWRVPGWLCDPLGPLRVRPAHLPRLLPWLRRFLRAGRPDEVLRIAAALAALAAPTYDDLVPMLETLGLSGDLHRVGALWVYASQQAFAAAAADRALRRRHGIVFDEIGADEARALEPALGPKVARAVLTPQWSHVADPKRLVDRLRAYLIGRGVRILAREVDGIGPRSVTSLQGDAVGFDTLVVAAGAWSGRLARRAGDRVSIESERGYNATLPAAGVTLSREVIFAEHSFVATPLSVGLRIGGAAEFAGLDAPADHRRSDALVRLARLYLPGLDAAGAMPWMGHRPTTPDSLPVIGRSPSRPGIVYAFGHGHTGLTLGPTTGRLVADLVAGRTPPIDLGPFSIGRFG